VSWRKAAQSLWWLALLLVAAGVSPASELRQLPAPTGKYSVGRSSFLWFDRSRSKRPVQVEVWYPAETSKFRTSPYRADLSAVVKNPATKAALQENLGPSYDAVVHGELRAHAHDDVPLAKSDRPLPLLLFSPGLGWSSYDYSVQLEDLASHGYVVCGVEHVQDTFGVVLSGGRVEPFDDALWSQHPASSGNPENLQFYEARAALWAQDMLFALDELSSMAKEKNSKFYGAIDSNVVGAFGHSHGGRSAAATCLLDARIKSCLNEDGSLDGDELPRPYWPMAGRTFAGAFAMLDWFDSGVDAEDLSALHTSLAEYASSRLKPGAAALAAYCAPRKGSYRLTMLQPGMLHTAFSDVRWLSSTSDGDRLGYSQYLATIRTIVREFFDETLKHSQRDFQCGSVQGQVLMQCFLPSRGQSSTANGDQTFLPSTSKRAQLCSLQGSSEK
jgi:predicted dienelactone hydrolase